MAYVSVLVWTTEHVSGFGSHLAVLMASCALPTLRHSTMREVRSASCAVSELPCRGAVESGLVSSI